MAMYKYIRNTWQTPEKVKEVLKERILEWRRSDSTVRLEYPTRLDRARSLGYKAKQGFVIVRQRVTRGPHVKPRAAGGRRPKRFNTRKNLNTSYQTICEQRANDKYPNCEVLNSYFLAKDGKHYWYEVILIDRAHPAIQSDKQVQSLAKVKGRVYRGLTSSARKSRQVIQMGWR